MTESSILSRFKIITQIAQGDTEATEKYADQISTEDAEEYIKFIANSDKLSVTTQKQLLKNVWRTHYKVKPPSIREFLTEEWIGTTANGLYPWIPETLTKFWDSRTSYRNLILSAGIGAGKSLCSTINSLYSTVLLWCMRNPRKLFSLSSASNITYLLMSFTQKKVDQVLSAPLKSIIMSSQKFQRVRFESKLEIEQKNNPNNICWTSSGPIGPLQFSGRLFYAVGSNVEDILGLSVISVILSEISFFEDRGYSAEDIWKLYSKNKGRIASRFGNNFFARTTIDSSPNDIQNSPIDQYIFDPTTEDGNGRAYEDPTNLVVRGSQWNFVPKDRYPIWESTGETFLNFRGSDKELPKIITESAKKNYLPREVYNVPIDLKRHFEEDPVGATKDFCGWPTGSGDYFFGNTEVIEGMFDDSIPNFYSFFWSSDIVDLFEKVKEKCFGIHDISGQLELLRAPWRTRYLHIDLSETKDACGIAMCHSETRNGLEVCVFDFTICIVPQRHHPINYSYLLDFFDHLRKAKIRIGCISMDRYQSSLFLSVFEKWKIQSHVTSVDTNMTAYRLLRSKMMNGLIKMGRNIIVKNNLRSLREVKMSSRVKIDHTKGKENWGDIGDWASSRAGFHAKDVSDAVCAAFQSCFSDMAEQDYLRSFHNKNSARNSIELFLEKNRLETANSYTN